VSGRLKALLLLVLAMLRVLLRRALGRRGGLAQFRANYAADALPSVTVSERVMLRDFGGCIACGLCDAGEAGRIAHCAGQYTGVMGLVLASSRNMPEFAASVRGFDCVPDEALGARERVCPARVPLRQLARFVRGKAQQLGDAPGNAAHAEPS
jgi:hypothetical protein